MAQETTFKVSYSVYSFFFRESFRFTKKIQATNAEMAEDICKVLNPLAEEIVVESEFKLEG